VPTLNCSLVGASNDARASRGIAERFRRYAGIAHSHDKIDCVTAGHCHVITLVLNESYLTLIRFSLGITTTIDIRPGVPGLEDIVPRTRNLLATAALHRELGSARQWPTQTSWTTIGGGQLCNMV